MEIRSILIGLVLVAGVETLAADGQVSVMSLAEGASSPPARIADLAWLQGRWVGQGLGGTAEDLISPAADGQMMGMFRHLKADGSVNFYEFYLFAEEGGSLTQRLKHYSPMLAGWEEKDEFVNFPLVAIEERAAYFDGLSYVLDDDGGLTVAVRIAEDQVATFSYRRAD